MCREAVASGNIRPPEILAPPPFFPRSYRDVGEKLLIPAQRAKKLRSKLVLRFKIIGECVCIARPRNLKARFVKLRPDLQMVPGKACILPENKLAKVIDIAAAREGSFGFWPRIWAVA